jgi:hypothetical protein
VGLAFWVLLARAADDGLGAVNFVVDGTHGQALVDKLSDEFLAGESELLDGVMVCLPIHQIWMSVVPLVVFSDLLQRSWSCCVLPEMGCVLARDFGLMHSQGNFADHCWWGARKVQSAGCVEVGADVECFHPGQLAPFLLVVLVAFDVFPFKSESEPAFCLDDFVCCVVFGHECCPAGKAVFVDNPVRMRVMSLWLSVAVRVQGVD